MTPKRGVLTAALLGAGLTAGCMAHEQAQEPEQAKVSSAQQASQQALNEAAQAQQKARDAQAAAEKAHQGVVNEQQRLTEAETNWHDLQLKAQQAQDEARRTSETAASQAGASQQRALEAQQSQADSRAKRSREFHQSEAKLAGGHQLEGTLAHVGDNSIDIQAPDKGRVTLRFDQATNILLDGQPSAADLLPEGAEIRASYEMKDGLQTATKIEVSTTPAAEPNSQQQTNPSQEHKGAQEPSTEPGGPP